MNQNEIKKLLNKFKAGKCSDEELQLLQQLMHDVDQDADERINTLKHVIWERLEKQLTIKGKIRKLNTAWVRVAAVLLIAVCTGLFYSKIADYKTKEIAYQVITAPKGSMKQIILPDSTTVQLNAGTSLKFPSAFISSKREVTLISGEAFFSVKHDALKPFLVHTAQVTTQVLGTSFNIKFYKELPQIQVFVNSGKVEIHDKKRTLGMYTPSQQLTYNKQDQSFVKQLITNDHSLSWMRDELILDNVSLKEISVYLKNRYNVHFKYDDEKLNRQYYSVRFSNKLTINQVIDVLQLIDGRKYRLQKNIVNIE